jgi:ABC-2 type transport system permease protein
MSVNLMTATSGRVLRQLHRDPRTIALIVVVPCVLLWLFKEVYREAPLVFQQVAPSMLGVFPFVTIFLVTSVAMVRERTSGTLERLLTTPIGKADLVLGYGLAFGLLALVQGVVATTVALWLLDLNTPASVPVLLLLAVSNAVLGAALGLALSALARTEFQAVQFLPAVVLPQFLLCGLLAPPEQMAGWLDALSRVMPLRYAVEGMTRLTGQSTVDPIVWRDLVIVAGCAIAFLVLGAATLRRRSA